jgi:hypothetical protein
LTQEEAVTERLCLAYRSGCQEKQELNFRRLEDKIDSLEAMIRNAMIFIPSVVTVVVVIATFLSHR